MEKMPTYFILPACLLLTLALIPFTHAFTITPYEIKDLYATDATFSSDVDYWLIWPGFLTSSTANTIWYKCSTTYLVGGYNVLGQNSGGFFSRTYSGLASHNMIRFSFEFWAVDSWDYSQGDIFKLSFDGTTITGFLLDVATFPGNTCGASEYKDLKMRIVGQVQHTGSTLTFRVIASFNEPTSNESFGFREISLLMYNATPVTANGLCAYGSTNSASYCTGNCQVGYYYSSSCKVCHDYCKSCFGPGQDQCYECNAGVGAFWNGTICTVCDATCATCSGPNNNQCLTCNGTYPYLANNSYCISSCASPFITKFVSPNYVCQRPCTENQYLYPATPSPSCYSECQLPFVIVNISTALGQVTQCKSPCTTTDEYVFWDGSCNATCNFPLVPQTYLGIKTCTSPCNATQITYWTGSCESSCDFPLKQVTRFSRTFCDFPCTHLTFLYSNGSCNSQCDTRFNKLLNIRNENFCTYPCPASYYLYNNGDCSKICKSHFQAYNLSSDLYCDYPCVSGQYLYSNGTCSSSCEPRFTVRTDAKTGDKYCDYPCFGNQYLYSNGSCFASCQVNFRSYNLTEEKYCDYPCSSDQYLLNNGTCRPECPHFFSSMTTSNTIMSGALTITEKFCNFPCNAGEYLYSNGSCSGSCETHYLPSSYSSDKFCKYPCSVETNEYLYWNSSCITSCSSPLNVRTTTAGDQLCDYKCDSNQVLYWDGSCLTECLEPLKLNTEGNPSRNFCTYPCNSNEFLYWNGSCSYTCDSPLISSIKHDRQFCDPPCLEGYLYPNSACLASCPSPLTSKVVNDVKFCENGCESSEYLYWNESCLATCEPPLVKKIINGINSCDYPCTNTSSYLYWDGSCNASCPSPLTPITEGSPARNYCNFICNPNEYLYWNGSCSATCTYPLTSSSFKNRFYCHYPCNTDQYLYWNQVCNTSCPEPFVTRVEFDRKFCDYPCSGSNILYWDKSCIGSCDFPLKTTYENEKSLCVYPCEIDQYLYWNGSCQASCPLPLKSRVEFSRNYCNYPCLPSEYLYWNGSCISSCAFPLTPRTESDNRYCDYKCQTNEMLYWDGVCSDNCPSPLTLTTEGNPSRNFCSYGCLDSQVLYWNKSCHETCESPLVSYTQYEKQFCKDTCLDGYIYWNSSCLSSCPDPYVPQVENGIRYCKTACQSSYYVYYNGSCLSTCDPLFNARVENDSKYCDYPCDPEEYLYWNKSCLATCPTPLKERVETSVVTRKFCGPNCNSSQFVSWNGSCLDQCDTPFRQSLSLGTQMCNLPCDSTSDYYYSKLQVCKSECASPYKVNRTTPYLECVLNVSTTSTNSSNTSVAVSATDPLITGDAVFDSLFVASNNSAFTVVRVVKVMKYLRFLNVELPPRLERFGASRGRSILSPYTSSRLLQEDDSNTNTLKSSIQSVFGRNDLDSAFINNFSGTLIFLLAAIGAVIFFTVGVWISNKNKWELASALFLRLRLIIRWNLVVMLLATNIDDIILYTAIEFRSTDSLYGLSPNHFSRALCVIFILLITGLIMGAFWLVKKYQTIKTAITPYGSSPVDFATKWQDFQVIFRGFRDNKAPNQFFFLIYMFRLGFPVLITVCAQTVPVLVTLIQMFTSIAIIAYLIRMKPFKKRINQVQLLIYEYLAGIMNIMMFILTVAGVNDFTIVLGDIIIFGSDILNIIAIIFLIVRCTIEAINITRYIKCNQKHAKSGKIEKTRYIQILSIFFQQSNMGFEELNDEYSSYSTPNKRTPEEGTDSDLSSRKSLVQAKPESDQDTSQISFQKDSTLKAIFPHQNNSMIDAGGDISQRYMGDSMIGTSKIEEDKLHDSQVGIDVDMNTIYQHQHQHQHQKTERPLHQEVLRSARTPLHTANKEFVLDGLYNHRPQTEGRKPNYNMSPDNQTVLRLAQGPGKIFGLPSLEELDMQIHSQLTSPVFVKPEQEVSSTPGQPQSNLERIDKTLNFLKEQNETQLPEIQGRPSVKDYVVSKTKKPNKKREAKESARLSMISQAYGGISPQKQESNQEPKQGTASKKTRKGSVEIKR